MSKNDDVRQVHQNMTRLVNGEGSIDQAEEWYRQIQALQATNISDYLTPDEMDNLGEIMSVRRRVETISKDVEATSESSHLTTIIQKIMDMQFQSDAGQPIDLVEFEASFHVLRVSVPGVPWTNLILSRLETARAEDILNQAYNLDPSSTKTINL